jgi:hypothetical protein
MNLLLAAVVSAGLMFGITAQGGEYKSRGIDLKTLPAAVQKTITETAAGGKIIRVSGKTIGTAGGTMRLL